MSLVPYWIRHLRPWSARHPARQLINDEFFAPFARDPFFRDPIHYFRQAISQQENNPVIQGVLSDSEVKVDGKKVEIHLDVRNFKPDQIQVKTVGDEILVEGKHEVKEGDGWTRSHFERRFLLPEGFPPERVQCKLDGGFLKLIAFRAQPLPERSIPVEDEGAGKSEDKPTG